MRGWPLVLCGLLALGGAPARAQMGEAPFNVMVLADQLEYGYNEGENPFAWDLTSWLGGDWNRLWILSEGEIATAGEPGGEGELQLLYGRLVAPFWELRGGVRGDLSRTPDAIHQRAALSFGVEGHVPYLIEFEPTLYLSHQGDLSARAHLSHDLMITQRLVGQSRVELNAALQRVPAFGVGRGLNDLELGWRLRYEFSRKFAPYLGVEWLRRFGETAEAADAPAQLLVLVGLRAWL